MRPQLLRQALRATAARRTPAAAINAARPAILAPARASSINTGRFFTSTPVRAERDENDPDHDAASTTGKPGESGMHEGAFARTDETVRVEYPEEDQLPSSLPIQGRGGPHSLRTLAAFSMEDRVAVVTGGARGLGLVMAQALCTSGADVAIVDMNRDEAQKSAESLTQTFREENPGIEEDRIPRVTAHYCDVSSPTSVKECIKDVIKQHGKITNLVTSAGFTENYDAINYPHDRIQKLWGVNVDGTYLMSVEVAKHLMDRQAPGAIVFIGSMSGAIVNVPQPQAPYNAAKAAVRHLASSLAVEWAHAGIRVNVISPGYMLTALTKKILDDNPDLKHKWTSLIPQGKMGRPEDLMGAVTFLSSDASLYVTGADLRVDGGYTIT
ncbi:D-arabinitol dehydrogenase-like protein [Aulographum hederae CBS 113979]|uniref:NADP-dependent mannitol dehydrogenase n=1 Tax=Aulographum hederae CBS 113979 TaxID=1176131 RepID=A0A6G1H700_9PEZI|nr:D-arabinitol dehydrogenase-like protein [Aulographum hederae CBS 113979]